MKVRKYVSSDRESVEYIHFNNGFIGKSLNDFLSNNKLWKSGISYYIEKEPESIFILEENGIVVGYLIGCLDDKNRAKSGIVFRISSNFFKSFLLPKKDRIFWRDRFILLFRALFGLSDELKFKTPKKAGHFHIGISPDFRGFGYGTVLLNEFEEYAKERGVETIHADGYGTDFNPNFNFWKRNGFKVYSKVRTSIWRNQLPEKEVFLVCYYKNLKGSF
jgi:GNAT superfamily N-acetyltransferase